MEIKYQRGLKHQQRAVDAITRVFQGVAFERPAAMCENPLIPLHDEAIGRNIRAIQDEKELNVPADARVFSAPQATLNLDIKMETGTGKTYVYTHAIYELHKLYGVNKFIVAVPTLAIKEGARSFMGDPDVRHHFKDDCGYDANIDLCVLTAQQPKNGKRLFPSEVREFVGGSHQISNRIYVLLVNAALISDSKAKMLGRDYDQTIEGYYCPLDALKATRPFLIIDEPHRFKQGGKTFGVIRERIQPQCIIRFGATFPEVDEKAKGVRRKAKDYQNLLYNLNAFQAFNENLVKGVAKNHFEPLSRKSEKIRLVSTQGRNSAVFAHITSSGTKRLTLYKGDSLGEISPEMGGIIINGIGSGMVVLSNGQEKHKGEEFDVDIYSTPYQEGMMRLAIQRHFETERTNFMRTQKIKTLALFFIDDIASFRGEGEGNNAWLRNTFDRLLRERLEQEIANTAENSQDYAQFLQASLDNIGECSAGYFARDNGDKNEAVAREVDDILRNKKHLLQFRNDDGSWNVRRFLFSKWTLKEGWDNPNVFTIAKLRSSGSETSKLQEVGRGLRLPVDEYGNRISDESFMLHYIVDFREADFANKLIAEINGDNLAGAELCISEDLLKKVAEIRDTNEKHLFAELLQKDFVDINKKVNLENFAQLNAEYPEFNTAWVGSDKVRNDNKKQPTGIRIRRERYKELERLWRILNRKYIIIFDGNLTRKIEEGFSISDEVFAAPTMTAHCDVVSAKDGTATVVHESETQYRTGGKGLPYGAFLRRINEATSLPIKTVHKVIAKYFSTHRYAPGLINEESMTRFIEKFNGWKAKNITGLVRYRQADYKSRETSLTDINGKLRDEIPTGNIGVYVEHGDPAPRYLYDTIAYDSDLEREDIKTKCDEIVVYGKIPRRSVAIPTLDGTYSPDFMYVVKRKDGKDEMNIVVETKGVNSGDALRIVEKMKIDCARKFFEQLKDDGFNVSFKEQTNNTKMLAIISSLLGQKTDTDAV